MGGGDKEPIESGLAVIAVFLAIIVVAVVLVVRALT